MQTFKWNPHEPLGEQVAELVLGANLDQFNAPVAVRGNVRPEPMVATGVVLGSRCHATGFQLAKGEGTKFCLRSHGRGFW